MQARLVVELNDFLNDRLAGILREQGYAVKEVDGRNGGLVS